MRWTPRGAPAKAAGKGAFAAFKTRRKGRLGPVRGRCASSAKEPGEDPGEEAAASSSPSGRGEAEKRGKPAKGVADLERGRNHLFGLGVSHVGARLGISLGPLLGGLNDGQGPSSPIECSAWRLFGVRAHRGAGRLRPRAHLPRASIDTYSGETAMPNSALTMRAVAAYELPGASWRILAIAASGIERGRPGDRGASNSCAVVMGASKGWCDASPQMTLPGERGNGLASHRKVRPAKARRIPRTLALVCKCPESLGFFFAREGLVGAGTWDSILPARGLVWTAK